METYYIQIPTEKREFFLNLMKELNFVKITENKEHFHLTDKEYVEAILASEEDIEKGDIISHTDLKNEVKSWLK